MPRSKIDALPQEVRNELNRELIARNFSDYEGLADWLGARGFEIGKSSIHRYGAKFEQRLEMVAFASEQAKAFVEALPDDQGETAEASVRMFQQIIFEILIAGEEKDLTKIASVGRALADITRASTTLRQERRKWRAGAADAAARIMKREGLKPDTASAIRAAIEGAQ